MLPGRRGCTCRDCAAGRERWQAGLPGLANGWVLGYRSGGRGAPNPRPCGCEQTRSNSLPL